MEDELNLGHLWRHLKAPLTHLYGNTGCARGQSLADVWLLFYLFIFALISTTNMQVFTQQTETLQYISCRQISFKMRQKHS